MAVDKETLEDRQLACQAWEVLLGVHVHPISGEDKEVGQVKVVQIGVLFGHSHRDGSVNAVGFVLTRVGVVEMCTRVMSNERVAEGAAVVDWTLRDERHTKSKLNELS